MTRYEFKTVSLRTTAGFKQAERMKASGNWRQISQGFDSVMFERVVPSKVSRDVKIAGK